MARFARVEGGIVREIITAEALPPFHPTIAAQFRSVADSVQVGWVDTNGTLGAPVPPAPTPQRVHDQAIAAGLTIVSTGTPALNGTYGLDAMSRANLAGIGAALALGIGFPPGNAPTLSYGDQTGAVHTFDATAFKNLAAAVQDYFYHLEVTLRTKLAGGDADWPSATMTID